MELGAEGFPCTIYVDGNRLTSADPESFEENLDILFSSSSTGEKLKSLVELNLESLELSDDIEIKTPDLDGSTVMSTTKSG